PPPIYSLSLHDALPISLGPQGPLGSLQLPFTFAGLVVASVLYSLPFAVQPIAAAFGSVDRKYIEASWMLGVSNFETFFRVIIPQDRKSTRLNSSHEWIS